MTVTDSAPFGTVIVSKVKQCVVFNTVVNVHRYSCIGNSGSKLHNNYVVVYFQV